MFIPMGGSHVKDIFFVCFCFLRTFLCKSFYFAYKNFNMFNTFFHWKWNLVFIKDEELKNPLHWLYWVKLAEEINSQWFSNFFSFFACTWKNFHRPSLNGEMANVIEINRIIKWYLDFREEKKNLSLPFIFHASLTQAINTASSRSYD